MTRSEIMSRIRSKNTKPELLVKRILAAAEISFVYQPHDIPGKPDFLIGDRAVFVDGCFWHKCPLHCKIPKTNTKFWENKIDNNRKRDAKYNRRLVRHGWKVARIWEHDLKIGGKKDGKKNT